MSDLIARLTDIYNDTYEGDRKTIKDAMDTIEQQEKRIKELAAIKDKRGERVLELEETIIRIIKDKGKLPPPEGEENE